MMNYLLLIIELIKTDISFGGISNYIVHITFWKQGDIYQFHHAATPRRDTQNTTPYLVSYTIFATRYSILINDDKVYI